jgi:beta-N-acetylhexosaminidase
MAGMLSAVTPRPYEPARDEAAVLALWEACLGGSWPIGAEAFRATIGESFVAEVAGRIVGFAATQSAAARGGLQVVLVEPAHRRRGIGRRLVDAALDDLRLRGVAEVRLGAGPRGYFWCGVPVNLPDAWAFFEALGWPELERAFDLLLDLDGYATPAWVYERFAAVALAAPGDADAVLGFERALFPLWAPHFERAIHAGALDDVLLARDDGGRIVGTALVLDPRAPWRNPFVWDRLLGELTGGPGTVGVAPDARDRGVGLALAARATELLRERGLHRSYVGWTWLVDWYAKLGYQVWAEHRVSARAL